MMNNFAIYTLLFPVRFFVLASLVFSVNGLIAQEKRTPTDVFYIAKSLDQSIVRVLDTTDDLTTGMLSQTIKPRNVYQKALDLLADYSELYNNPIEQSKVARFNTTDPNSITPTEVYAVLKAIRDDFGARATLVGIDQNQSPKTPSEVFQRLRSIALHLKELAAQKQVRVAWGTPGKVYQINLNELLPIIYGFARSQGYQFQTFKFSQNTAESVKPRHIFALLSTIYNELSIYFRDTKGYEPLKINPLDEIGNIGPGEVYDLTLILLGELKPFFPNEALNSQLKIDYDNWLAEKGTVKPGDVYYLVRHLFFTTVKSLEKS